MCKLFLTLFPLFLVYFNPKGNHNLGFDKLSNGESGGFMRLGFIMYIISYALFAIYLIPRRTKA